MADDLGIWGEGFADDGWADALTVARWDELHPDEALRLFPRLAGTAEARAGVAARLRAAMREARAARGRRDGASSPWRPWIVRADRTPDEEVLAAAEAVLRALDADQTPPCAEGSAFAVAFLAGAHPAYLWPDAALLAGRWTTAGWLGVLCRGRSALMPHDVAEELAAAIIAAGPCGGHLRDPRLALCGLSGTEWSELARFAARRLRGRRDIIQLPRWRLRLTFPAVGPHLWRGAVEALSR